MTGGGLAEATFLRVALDETGNGQVLVSGPSQLLTGELNMAARGDGTLTVRDGGKLESVRAVIADKAAGHGEIVVTGSGTRWINTDKITIGREGQAEVRVGAGGRIDTEHMVLGEMANSRGTLEVRGGLFQDYAVKVNRDLTIGADGLAEVDVRFGKLVVGGESIILGEMSGGDGRLVLGHGSPGGVSGNCALPPSARPPGVAAACPHDGQGVPGFDHRADDL